MQKYFIIFLLIMIFVPSHAIVSALPNDSWTVANGIGKNLDD